jgi:predicted enzyme related to lactoylglutathione lyase
LAVVTAIDPVLPHPTPETEVNQITAITTPVGFRGLSTLRLSIDDLDAANRWYTELFGVPPYFARDGYIEFRIGDRQTEIGIVDRQYLTFLGRLGHGETPTGAVAYWHVDDLDAALARLAQMGATEIEAKREFGDGFVAAAYADPFGNVLGVMHNRHYRDMNGA